MGIFGTLLGGVIADCLAKRLGYHGRPLNVTWFHEVPWFPSLVLLMAEILHQLVGSFSHYL